jgi:hypothetical protein
MPGAEKCREFAAAHDIAPRRELPLRVPPRPTERRLKKKKKIPRRVGQSVEPVEIEDALPEPEPARHESRPNAENCVLEIDFAALMEATGGRPQVPDENESDGETMTIDGRRLINSFIWDYREPVPEQGAFRYVMMFMNEQLKAAPRSSCAKRKWNI